MIHAYLSRWFECSLYANLRELIQKLRKGELHLYAGHLNYLFNLTRCDGDTQEDSDMNESFAGNRTHHWFRFQNVATLGQYRANVRCEQRYLTCVLIAIKRSRKKLMDKSEDWSANKNTKGLLRWNLIDVMFIIRSENVCFGMCTKQRSMRKFPSEFPHQLVLWMMVVV